MEKYIKLSMVGVIIVMAGVYLFTSAPKYLSQKDARQNYLADRSFFMEQRKTAMANLKVCFAEAQKNYDNMWARACKSNNDRVVESCVNQNVPEPVCRGKFPFSSSCDLPSAQGNMVQTYLNEQKAECNTIYKYEAAPIQDSHSDK